MNRPTTILNLVSAGWCAAIAFTSVENGRADHALICAGAALLTLIIGAAGIEKIAKSKT